MKWMLNLRQKWEEYRVMTYIKKRQLAIQKTIHRCQKEAYDLFQHISDHKLRIEQLEHDLTLNESQKKRLERLLQHIKFDLIKLNGIDHDEGIK